MQNYSTSEENYIKAIYHLHTEGTVTTNELAAELNTRAASVTGMMKKLRDKQLVHYESYKGFRLTAEGKQLALMIIRRHRLWEFFLAEKLRFNWDEVHAVAEEMEHVSSTKLIDKLDEFLGFPRYDPHGDPIPDAQGRIEDPLQICLTDLPVNEQAFVCYVSDQSSEMLEVLGHKKISIGTAIEVKKKFSFDQSMEVRIRQQPVTTISGDLAKNIFVKYEES